MAVGQDQWYHFGVGAPPFSSIVVGIGMFTGGTIWILTHGHVRLEIVQVICLDEVRPFLESPSCASPPVSDAQVGQSCCFWDCRGPD